MAKAKSGSPVIEKASVRLQGMKAISPTLDLGGGLNGTALEAAINDVRIKLDAYIHLRSELEEVQSAFEDSEKALGQFNTRILASVAARYGRDSVEYAQVGGTRSRDIKRSPRKPKTNNTAEI
jgi:hypothetical protein